MNKAQSYFWPVSVERPISGGKFEKETFDAEFKDLPQSRIKEIQKLIANEQIADIEFCKEVLIGWKGVNDGSGQDVPFSESARDGLLDISLVAGSIVRAYFASLSGAKAKN